MLHNSWYCFEFGSGPAGSIDFSLKGYLFEQPAAKGIRATAAAVPAAAELAGGVSGVWGRNFGFVLGSVGLFEICWDHQQTNWIGKMGI